MSVLTPEQFQAEVQRQQEITASIGTAAPAKSTKYVSPTRSTSYSGGGSPSAPAPAAPVKTAGRLEEEYQPIESMTLTEAKAQGYEYSGAAGWHRPRPTIKNVEMLRAQAMQQREELSHMQNVEQRSSPDPGRIYFIGDNQVSRAKYLNTLAVAQIKNSAYLGKLKTAGAQIHEAERLREKYQYANPPANNAGPIGLSGLNGDRVTTSTDTANHRGTKNNALIQDNRSAGVKKLAETQEKLYSRPLLNAMAWVQRNAQVLGERTTSRVTDPHVEKAVKAGVNMAAFFPSVALATIPFIESTIRHPATPWTSIKEGAKGAYHGALQDPERAAYSLVFGAALGGAAGHAFSKTTAPKLKITGVKSVGHDVFSVTSKTGKGKGTMYSYKAQYDVARQADSIIARMLGKKPKTEVVRVGTDVVGKFKKGKKFDLDASVRSGQENIVFAKISGKYSVKTLDKAGAKTPIKGVSREHGTLRHNTEMDIHHGKAGTSAVKIGAKGTKHTASTKITYSKFTRHQAAGKASIVDEATRAVFHSMDDSLSAGLARGRISARIIDTGKVKVSRTEGLISRVQGGGHISGGQPIVRHAPKPAPAGQPMKSMDVHLPTTRPGHTLQAMTQRVKQGQQAVIHKAEVLRQASMKATINYAMRNRPAVNTANMGRISGRILSMDSIILSAQDPERRQDRIRKQPVPTAQVSGQLQNQDRKNKVRPQMPVQVPSMDFLIEQARRQALIPRQGQMPRQGVIPRQEPVPRQTLQTPRINVPSLFPPVIPQLTRSTRIRLPLLHANRMQLGGMNEGVNMAQKTIHHQMMSAKKFLQM